MHDVIVTSISVRKPWSSDMGIYRVAPKSKPLWLLVIKSY